MALCPILPYFVKHLQWRRDVSNLIDRLLNHLFGPKQRGKDQRSILPAHCEEKSPTTLPAKRQWCAMMLSLNRLMWIWSFHRLMVSRESHSPFRTWSPSRNVLVTPSVAVAYGRVTPWWLSPQTRWSTQSVCLVHSISVVSWQHATRSTLKVRTSQGRYSMALL